MVHVSDVPHWTKSAGTTPTTYYQGFFFFFASQTLHKIKNLKKNPGAVNDEANFFCF